MEILAPRMNFYVFLSEFKKFFRHTKKILAYLTFLASHNKTILTKL